MKLPKPYRECSCRDPSTGRRLGKACQQLGQKGHGAWYARYEAPRSPGGRRRQPRIGPFRTEKACKEALLEALGRVGQGAHTAPGSGEDNSPLPVAARELNRHGLAALLARHTFTYRLRSGKDSDGQPVTYEEEVTPTPQQLSATLEPLTWPGLGMLRGIAGAPLLRPDGTLLHEPGYDPATGLYLAYKVPLDQPSQQQVDEARAFLLDSFLRDFPWVGDPDRANYLAILATPVLRWYVRSLIPFAVFTATMPGSGKTILTSGPRGLCH